MLTYELPLNEIVLDFLRSAGKCLTRYASLITPRRVTAQSDLIKLDILVGCRARRCAGLIIPPCNFLSERGRDLVTRLRKLIPRQMFRSPHPGPPSAVASSPAKLLPPSQKRSRQVLRRRLSPAHAKLSKKQKEGKKRMKRVGQVDIPQEAFPCRPEVDAGEDE